MPTAVSAGTHPASFTQNSEWEAFKSAYVFPTGRVIDTGNRGISHSEGQGYGMLFAQEFGDRETFDSLWDWTKRTLGRHTDALHSWCYNPALPQPVADLNNATDGDLFIAYALTLAGWRWREPKYLLAAAAIAKDILRLAVLRTGKRTLLLPGVNGFVDSRGVVVNQSYYAFFAMEELNSLVPSPIWDELRRDGMGLLSEARFGNWKLPPDWLQISASDGQLTPAQSHPARFSFDAIRIPLYVAWSQLPCPGLTTALATFWGDRTREFNPAWVDLQTGQQSPYQANSGIVAVQRLWASMSGRSAAMSLPSVTAGRDYYSASLILLSRIAANRVASLA